MPIDFKGQLNSEQLAAVTAPDGPLLVLAAAGTGKTRTLVYRVAYLVENGAAPEDILLLTFTNRAAKEMLERARDLVGAEASGVWGGTFHHMANRLLRRHAKLLGYTSDFSILDRDDSRSILGKCVTDEGIKSKEFPKSDVLMSLAGSAANTETPLRQVVAARFEGYEIDSEKVLKILKAYVVAKREMNAMDFDDLLVNCLQLFEEHPDVLTRYQDQFKHVLVDEYQDTNTVQAKIVDHLAKKSRNLLVVGDDFQSIYAWRGANYKNIMSFPEKYKAAGMCKLETNYRSVPEILEVANACIAGNPDQFQKVLRPTRPAYRRPRVISVRDGAEQARHVAAEIAQLQYEGYSRSDIAVLYRAHYHAMDLQIVLTRARIPHAVTSGIRFFEQAHIKDVCSVLRILVNPSDVVSFGRLLQLLPGIGKMTVSKIWRKLGGSFDVTDENHRSVLRSSVPKASIKAWIEIEAVLLAYKDEGLCEDGGEVMHRFVEVFYDEYVVRTFDDFQRRLDDIKELIFHTAESDTVEEFLADIALLTNIDVNRGSSPEKKEDSVCLSTVHQAKGLEWPVVIILWATEGMFPSSRSIEEGGLEAEAEERRLFYVAVTRAKDNLYMYVPEVRRTRDGGVFCCTPSRFVQEIPDELVKRTSGGFI
jgi:DNA helicase-2/ATP-dependent DNA helicase PcrA